MVRHMALVLIESLDPWTRVSAEHVVQRYNTKYDLHKCLGVRCTTTTRVKSTNNQVTKYVVRTDDSLCNYLGTSLSKYY